MQSRRHVVVAVVIVTVQVFSLAIATDILGADVSDYARPSETIEAVGTESDLDAMIPEDSAHAGDDGWVALDASEAEAIADDTAVGFDLAPDQLAVVDDETDMDEETPADPTIDQSVNNRPPVDTVVDPRSDDPAAGDADSGTTAVADPAVDDTAVDATALGGTAAASTTSTTGIATATGDDGGAIEQSIPDIDPALGQGASAPAQATTIPLTEAGVGNARPVGAAVVSTTSLVPASSTSSTVPVSAANRQAAIVSATTARPITTAATSTTISTAITAAPRSTVPTTTTSLPAPITTRDGHLETTSVTRSTTPPTTWLPATTNTPITTWVTTIPTTTVVTAPIIQTTRAAAVTPPPTTVPSTTRPSTTVASTTTAAPVTTAASSNTGSNAGLSAISNTDPRFGRYASVPSAGLSLANLTEPAPVRDNGSVGDGQFRAACQYSHFAYDDPIVFPGQSGRSHLHMFFGNTKTNAFSNTNSIVNSGGGSCNGFELNRSAYWTPALLDGKGNAVVPDMIILYYKSKEPTQVQRMPQGLKMVSGNTSAESFAVSDFLYWSCGNSGFAYNKSNRIPNCNGDIINATIAFPQCWDGVNMDSADHRSHMALVSPHKPCPASHPVRLPQISILFYFPGQASVNGWHLASDRTGFSSGPGASLHADWWGGWNDETMDLWTNGCMKAARNCSFGQTGTDRQLAKLNNFQNYQGPNFLPLP